MNKISIALPEDRQELKRLLGISGAGRPDDSNRSGKTTLQEIADRAKCSIGSVALYFNEQEPDETPIPERILKAIIKIINEKPILLRRLLEMQESAARIKRTKR